MTNEPYSAMNDMIRISFEIEDGCLPPAVGMTPQEFRQLIGNYDSNELLRFNPEMGENMPTQCYFPYHIIGFTKDRKVAYYGVNYINAKPLDELTKVIYKSIASMGGKDLAIARIAAQELSDLLK